MIGDPVPSDFQPKSWFVFGGNAYWIDYHAADFPANHPTWMEAPMLANGTIEFDNCGAIDGDRIDEEYAKFFEQVRDKWTFMNAAWSDAESKLQAGVLTRHVNQALGLPLGETTAHVGHVTEVRIKDLLVLFYTDLNEGHTCIASVMDGDSQSDTYGESFSYDNFPYGDEAPHAVWGTNAFYTWVTDCVRLVGNRGKDALPGKA